MAISNLDILKEGLKQDYKKAYVNKIPDKINNKSLKSYKEKVRKDNESLSNDIAETISQVIDSNLITINEQLDLINSEIELLQDLTNSSTFDDSTILARLDILETDVDTIKTDLTNSYGFYITGRTVEYVATNGVKRLRDNIYDAVIDGAVYGGHAEVHNKGVSYSEAVPIPLIGCDIVLNPGVIIASPQSVYYTFSTSVSGDVPNCKIIGPDATIGGMIVIDNNNFGNVSINIDTLINTNPTYGINIFTGKLNRLKLKCNKLYSVSAGIIMFVPFPVPNVVPIFEIDCKMVETGIADVSGTTAILLNGNGYINVDEILINNYGHCFRYDGRGECNAKIKKMIINSHGFGSVTPPVSCIGNQSYNPCKLNLEFDEILSLDTTSSTAPTAIILSRGEVNLKGRRVYTDSDHAVSYQQYDATTYASGLINIKEIESKNWSGLDINTPGLVTVRDTKIIGNPSSVDWGAVVLGYSTPVKVEFNNVKILNGVNETTAHGIIIKKDSTSGSDVVLDSVSIKVTGDSNSIYTNTAGEKTVIIERPYWFNKVEGTDIKIIGNGFITS
jgi:hypothetical protein